MPPQEIKLMLALSMVPQVGPATFNRLLEGFGSAEAVFAASTADLARVSPPLKAESITSILSGPNLRAVRFQEEACMRLKVRIVSVRSDKYPAPLRTLAQPPAFLFMAGEWKEDDVKGLAVVGTRYPSSYGSQMVRELSAGMGEAGFTIISGLARGIDTLAHNTALTTGARTIAVLGSGLDWIYPPENVPLARRIAQQGCVISEFPMGAAPHATHFPRRNRIISALSLGTVVVEAGNDSGALITADYAMDQGREVFAVPGAVHQPGTNGTHKLIQEGAHLVERAEDIIRLLQGTTQAVPARRFSVATEKKAEIKSALQHGIQSEFTGKLGEIKTEVKRITPKETAVAKDKVGASTVLESAAVGLNEEARSLLSLMGREAITLDAIAEKARLKPRFKDAAPHRLLVGLLDLEMKGRVKRMPGALFRLS